MNVIEDKSFKLSLRIVKLNRYLTSKKKEYVMSKQLLRSGTSIGANVSEAVRTQSKKDFISKLSIALKEANESDYWIRLLIASEYIEDKNGEDLLKDLDEVIKLLVSIIKTSRESLKDGKENEELRMKNRLRNKSFNS